MSWFDILKEVEFIGGIVYTIPKQNPIIYNEGGWELPEGHKMLEQFHVTLLSPQQIKPFKSDPPPPYNENMYYNDKLVPLSNTKAKKIIKKIIQDFMESNSAPKIIVDTPSMATRGKKETLFLPLANQGEWRTYCNELSDSLGLNHTDRYFHISVSNNQGGNPHNSIGNINTTDEGGRYT
jgi:hypothetical protein